MQVLSIVVDDQIVGAFIAWQVFPLDYQRISNNYYLAVRTVDIDKTATDMERLMNVAQKMN
jgi:hypothetical protein